MFSRQKQEWLHKSSNNYCSLCDWVKCVFSGIDGCWCKIGITRRFFSSHMPFSVVFQRQRQRGPVFRICPVCERQFDSRAKLEIHIRTHTGERPFACPHCPYQACQMSTLTSHMRTHTGEKPFQCPFCSHRARQRGSLNKHIRVVHSALINEGGEMWPGNVPNVWSSD